MIIGVAGYKGSGKDTVGKVLTNSFNFKQMSFAQPIKDLVHDTFGIDKNILQGNGGERIFRELEMPEWFNLTPRQLLQKIGMAFRNEINEDVWIKILENKYKKQKDNVIITDVRFPNEVKMIEKYGFVMAVKRPGYNGDEHESEHALDNHVFKYVFDNNGSEELLYSKVYNFLKDRLNI